MSDTYDYGYEAEEDEAPAETPRINPLLTAFEAGFETPEGQAWAHDAVRQVQTYLNRQALADANQAAGEAFVLNLSSFKDGLTKFVQAEPEGASLALDLIPGAIAAVIDTNPGTLHGDGVEHYETLTGVLSNSIATTAVQSYAVHSDVAAREAMERYGEFLTNEDRTALDGFIVQMAAARENDEATAAFERARQAEKMAGALSYQWVKSLTDENGEVRFPENWARGLALDTRLDPDTKAMLSEVYSRAQDGDAPASDPFVVGRILEVIASGAAGGELDPREVLRFAGGELKIADALMLAQLTPKSAGALNATMGAAQRWLATPENGPAGRVAFERFVSWLLPTVRDGANFDPNSPDYILRGNRMQAFAPSPMDMADIVLNQYNRDLSSYDTERNPPEQMMAQHPDRPSLGEVFGRGWSHRPTGDPVIRRPAAAPIEMPNADNWPTPGVVLGRPAPPMSSGDPVVPSK